MADTHVAKDTPSVNPLTGRPFLGEPNVLNVGIICPWNMTAGGPAKQRIHCSVWKNWDDFLEWGHDAGRDPYFCRVHCQFGRNPEMARRAREIRERQFRPPGWMKAIVEPPDFMFPPERRKLP